LILHVEVHDGTGPFLLLVHGILSSRAQWRLNVEALSRVTRPVVVELWGHGRSPAPPDPESYSPDGYVQALEAVRTSIGADRWLICGQSLGAALTLRYTLDHPDRVIAQVFTNSSSALAGAGWRRGVVDSLPPLIDDIERRGMPAVQEMRVHPVHARRLPADVKAELVEDAAMLNLDALANTFRHTVPSSSVRDRVAATAVPTLLIAGGRERAFGSARQFALTNINGLEVVDLEAGHAVNIEASDGFNQAVTRFVARVAA
jgi:pimeloyl-ACP methyl ester carboxylesterase